MYSIKYQNFNLKKIKFNNFQIKLKKNFFYFFLNDEN